MAEHACLPLAFVVGDSMEAGHAHLATGSHLGVLPVHRVRHAVWACSIHGRLR